MTAAFLGGLMRMSASMCLILMEMTGAANTLPFLMLVIVIAKGVGDRCVTQHGHRQQGGSASDGMETLKITAETQDHHKNTTGAPRQRRQRHGTQYH